MKWIVRFTDKGMVFASEYARATFLEFKKRAPLQKFKLEPYDKKSKEKLGYFFGGLVPAYAEWSEYHDRANKDDLIAIAEEFKKEHNYVVRKGLDGAPRKQARGISELNNKEYGAFIERVVRYFEEQQIPIPDPDLYKEWNEMFRFDYPDFYTWLDKLEIKCDGSPK